MSSRNIGITIVLVCCVAVAYLAGRNAALNEELQQKQQADVTITQPDGTAAPIGTPQKLTSANVTPTPETTPKPCIVIGNKSSGIYHLPGCASYHKVREHNREYFCTEEEAQKAGYRKAKNC